MTTFDIKLTTKFPVHIGDGTTLHNKFDFISDDRFTMRLNEETILKKYGSQLVPGSNGFYRAPGDLLSANDKNDSQFFRYIIPGTPHSVKEYSELKSCIKDVYDRPYIPGSSLKGAIRTALAWAGFQERNLKPSKDVLFQKRKEAGQIFERELFGVDPNHSIMRALQVSDLTIDSEYDKPGGGLKVFNAQVITEKSSDSPIQIEAIRRGVGFYGTIKVDSFLFPEVKNSSPYALEVKKKLGFGKRADWCTTICERTTRNSIERIERLLEWFSKVDGSEKVTNYYNDLLNSKIGENETLIQLGWGTGWDGMTFGALLQEDKYLFEQIVSKFNMSKLSKSGIHRQPGEKFPKSRRVITHNGASYAPLGWVMVEFKERKS